MTDENENEDSRDETEEAPAKPAMDPVRKWTLIILGACVVLMFWYLVSDRDYAVYEPGTRTRTGGPDCR